MTRDEAARAIGVAVTEIKSADETEHGVAVVMSNGARRLLVDGDGFYSLDDHSANKGLRRWTPPEGTDEDLDPETDPDGPAGGGQGPGEGEGGELVVPDGNVEEVMAWVDGEPAKALAALEHERAKASPRKSLIDRLEKVETAP
jgi:hypothetical protein